MLNAERSGLPGEPQMFVQLSGVQPYRSAFSGLQK